MADSHKNLAVSTVLTAPSPAISGTTLVLSSGGGSLMPAVPFTGTVWAAGERPGPTNAELVRVTARSTDTLTIVREAEDSDARTILVGDNFAATITAAQMVEAERSTELLVSQTAHGFDVGDVLKLIDDDEYALAQADSAANGEVAGIVSGTPSANTFVLTVSGYVDGLSGLTAGVVYFLSPDTPGAMTATDPTADGTVSRPLLLAHNATSGQVKDMRGAINTSDVTDGVPFLRESRTGAGSIVQADLGKVLECANGTYTLSLDADSTLGDGWHVTVWNNGLGMITVDAAGADTIDGAADMKVHPGESRLLMCMGADFKSFQMQDAYPWTYVRKTADETLNTNIVNQDDNELFFTTVAGAIYEVETFILYSSPVGGTTPDLKVSASEDATLRGVHVYHGLGNTDGAAVVAAISASGTNAGTGGSATTTRAIKMNSVIWTNGGTFKLQWSQGTSNANNIVVEVGSYMRYRRIR